MRAEGPVEWTGPSAASVRFLGRRMAFRADQATAKRLLRNDKGGARLVVLNRSDCRSRSRSQAPGR